MSDGSRDLPNVSRETLERLHAYADLLIRWQARINLIGSGTVDETWRRHFVDSAQLFSLVEQPHEPLIDLGSGAGFPGLVLAIMGLPNVTLVESNARKCAFLREVARITGTSVEIVNSRIEMFHVKHRVQTVTARALTELDGLLNYAHPLLADDGICLFPKGKNVEAELTAASKRWNMEVTRIRSISDDEATILKIRGLRSRS